MEFNENNTLWWKSWKCVNTNTKHKSLREYKKQLESRQLNNWQTQAKVMNSTAQDRYVSSKETLSSAVSKIIGRKVQWKSLIVINYSNRVLISISVLNWKDIWIEIFSGKFVKSCVIVLAFGRLQMSRPYMAYITQTVGERHTITVESTGRLGTGRKINPNKR